MSCCPLVKQLHVFGRCTPGRFISGAHQLRVRSGKLFLQLAMVALPVGPVLTERLQQASRLQFRRQQVSDTDSGVLRRVSSS